MTLPTSRNTTYAPTSPLLSADLNAIQDQIVGYKHPALTRILYAADFQQAAGGLGSLSAIGAWTFTGAATLLCSLGSRIPIGSRIISLKWWYNRGGAGTMTHTFDVYDLAATLAATNLDTFADTTTTGLQNSGTRALTYTTVLSKAQALRVAVTNAANIFYGVEVGYDRL